MLAFIIIQVYTIFCQKEGVTVELDATVLSQLSDIILII